MALAVLNDDHVKTILENLTLEEFESFKQVLSSTLHEYSNNIQSVEDDTYQQPGRISTHSKATGATTLYMPSCSPAGMGIKVVTLSSAENTSADASRPVIRPTGAITLLSPQGRAVGLVHAETLTAFRTALASTCLLSRRRQVKTVTVFGSGLQAYWHIRLALLLRGSTIKTVNIINRRFSDNAKGILKKFYGIARSIKEREGWQSTEFSLLTPGYGEYNRLQHEQIRAADVIFCCTPSTEELFDAHLLTTHEARKKGRLVVAVGSYTPKMRELPVEFLQQATKRYEGGHRHFHKHAPEGGVIVVDTIDGVLKEAGEIIDAGILPTQLIELGELVMLQRLSLEESETDSASSITSSEFEKLDLTPGTSAMSSVFSSETTSSDRKSRSSFSRESSSPTRRKAGLLHRRSSSHSSIERQKSREDSMCRWLRDGTVIYKSVGLGLMDLAVSMHLVKVAAEKKIGNHIDGF